ncbi:DUF5053 domain-containing protein [Dysgonomonas sp. 521]|uniref:DUF5053 domain-containing protein n=1 Tax=Dysgonomonas sp. 521 TaxID=2302932 RepID=UPI0013D0B302|nr:DUF5053 domain-containing protein [Dysgonomonas sp. 521]NDV96456.1 DUF5053 domain-containing protein [Dysgonomonas sp. 521]
MKREDFYKDLERFKSITDPEELKAFEKELKEKHSQASKEDALETLTLIEERVDELISILKVSDITKIVSMSYIATKYFKKSRSWLHQRLNGDIVNGKPAKFTNDEKRTLKLALEDISKKMQETSSKIVIA